MMTMEEYKQNPCRLSSIPYWKMKTINVPDNIKVIHDKEFVNGLGPNEVDTMYFRLKHDLTIIERTELPHYFSYKEVNTRNIDELLEVVEIINASYEDIKVNLSQVKSWIESDVFQKELWVFVQDDKLEKNIALGIAELDKELKEGILEWIQVLPKYRGRGLGRAVVTNLLLKMQPYAEFATVSGQINNKTNPENIYRRCGFTGNDVWHVIVAN